jgi:acyl-homoserine-lactone acylase
VESTWQRGWRPFGVLGLAGLAACGGTDRGGDARFQAEIRRTSLGVPHIKAANWGGLGYGVGYAQAQDNLCTMADSFLTYRGERSRHFGGEALAVYDSTIARNRNVDSDFFHRHLLTDASVQALAQAQPAEIQQQVAGFAAGYNRYLRDLRAAPGAAHAACRDQVWVQPVADSDIWRRMLQALLAGGYSNFVAAIANAAPPRQGPQEAVPAAAPAGFDPARTRPPRLQVGGDTGIGSNMVGFGSAVTGGDGPLLFGNPHWYWRGPDRFYQAQLTIPGQVDVSGVSFLGIASTQIGFNNDVAWSHTVSTARRFGFFQLSLAPGDPTSYLRDGVATKMTATPITVQVREASGALTPVTRTLYRSVQGPLIDLAMLNPALAWNQTTAFVMRDINGENYRTFRTWWRWAMARSLDEFIAIQKQDASIPWVNTVAVGRGDARAWYADIGAVPNVSPQQVADCTTPFGQAVAPVLPDVPFFDGARSACDWQSDADSVQPGAVGPARMPSLLREDYVANMNDSYWLAQPAAPLTGYPAIFGPAGTAAQSLRTRLGHTMVQQRLAGTDGYAGRQATSAIVREMVLNSRVHSAERFKDQALDLVCTPAQIAVTGDALTGESFSPARTVDVQSACAALRAWGDAGNAQDRASHVWDEFWGRVGVPAAQLYAVPFDAADPLNTPRDLQAGAATALRQAFGAAVLRVQESGYALDAPRGEVLFAVDQGARVPLYGGCSHIGYFTITCANQRIEQGGYSMEVDPYGNSYMQVVNFPAGAVQAHTFLTFSMSDDPASAHHRDYTRRYGAKQWLALPYTEAQITGDAGYSTMTVRE